jgi:Septin family protein
MKYGIIYYKETDNIGDDIQSYAAAQLLPSVDCLVDRESLNEFSLPDNKKVAVILNGCFLHKKYNWPPSNNIIPLCISMHFTPNDHWGIGYNFLDGAGGDYLRNFGAIGCWDSHTLNALKSRNIDAYISGCLTLTLNQRIKSQHAGSYVCAVDIPKEAENEMSERLSASGIELKKETHWVDYKKEQLSWDERMQRVEGLLDVYQNARCVVTKRLHCALPCLAMGVPVLLLYDEDKDDVTRYQYFLPFLSVSTVEDFLNKKDHFELINPADNSGKHLTIANELEKRTKEFTYAIENDTISVSGLSKSYVEKWRTELLEHMADSASNELKKEKEAYRNIEKLAVERATALVDIGEYAARLKQQVESLQKSHDILEVKCMALEKKLLASEQQLEIIYRSRLMRIALSMRNMLRRK